MNKTNDKLDDLNIPLKSYWLDSTPVTDYPALNEDINVDIAIIGGGITGISCAHLLKKEGYKVAVIDADRIAQGTTGHTTAYVTSQHDIIYDKLIQQMGKDIAKQYADANQSAIDSIENLVNEYKIDCDFKRLPAYMYVQDKGYVQQMKDEAKAAKSLGINARYVDNLNLPFHIEGGVCFENQAQFHPRKYILSIAEKIPNDGSHIFENTKIVDIKDNEKCIAITEKGNKITCSKLILASHFPFYDGLGFYFARLNPSRDYVIAAKVKGKLPEGTFVDEGTAGYYFRSQVYGEDQIMIFGIHGNKTGHGEDITDYYRDLKKFAESNFNVEKFLYRWSAQDYITLDGAPYIGYLNSSTDNIYVATGYGKWGMTNGTVAAILIKDLITKKENPWKDVYNPSRGLSVNGLKNAVKLNLDVAVQLITGKLKGGEDDMSLKKGEGKVVIIEGEKYGAYRDFEDNVHIVDITCTHVGCELKWNDAEKSWDCPCHGSRFNYEGEIMEGPAVCKLNHYKDGDNTIDSNIL